MRDRLWKRLARREALNQQKSPPDRDERDSFFALIRPHLDALTSFVRHLIGYAEASGDLVRNEVAVEDLVDDTLLRAYQLYLKKPVRENARAWLTHIAADRLDAIIKSTQTSPQVHIEDDIPETPAVEGVSTLGDEIMDFYQPDEDLKVEDLVPDLELLSPEEEFEAEEIRQHVRTEFNALPPKWRKALLLRYMEGQSNEVLARNMGLKISEAERIITYASAYIRQRLVESGCRLKETRRLA
jgi:RNA polymerase sigma factor (sigma-70 family)